MTQISDLHADVLSAAPLITHRALSLWDAVDDLNRACGGDAWRLKLAVTMAACNLDTASREALIAELERQAESERNFSRHDG